MNITFQEEKKIIINFATTEMQESFGISAEGSGRKRPIFHGKESELFDRIDMDEKGTIYVGLGSTANLTLDTFRKAGFRAAKHLKKQLLKEASVRVDECADFPVPAVCAALAEGFLQSEYKFLRYKSDPEEKTSLSLSFLVPQKEEESARNAVREVEILVEAVFHVRDLVNTPSIDLYPETLAAECQRILSPLGISVEVYDEKQISDMGMSAFLAVSRGSSKPPRFVVMKYLPLGENEPHLTYVGKGLTYDSGGYSIKPRLGMITMKCDMAGSATVIGTLYALAKLNIRQNVVGIAALCENMISGDAYKNGDIIPSMKGTTIEVRNTDAEGRLTLADALYFAATKLNTSAIVDVATLTGDSLRAFGPFTSGAVSNDDDFYDALFQASACAGEHIWRFPVIAELREFIKSDVADIRNATEKPGGAITAGLFLETFVEGLPWIHLDIAGTTWSDSGYGYISKYATGIPMKSLYYLAKNYSASHSKN